MLNVRPDEIGMEFGIKFSAKFGTAILASANGETTFKVSMKWTNPKTTE
ncbi:MAG: CU044_2847 family protein [Desulfococcaceae bacterium]